MNKKYRILLLSLLALVVIVAIGVLLSQRNVAVLNPKGIIADKERNLMIIALALSAFVVIPVFTMLFTIAFKYRVGNTKPKRYEPEWDHSRLFESIWWGIPCLIILILGVVTWQATHDLDPYKALASNVKPIKVQVISLDWKWLFIYPEQRIASVNFLQFPVNTPIDFELTSDAPMNSFWVPSLGGQIYTMSGMSTQLHLMANATGDYHGSSANISGAGFAGMTFTARASSQTSYDAWIQSAKKSPKSLGINEYNTLASPSKNNPVTLYALKQNDLYDTIVMKYMIPSMPGMETQ